MHFIEQPSAELQQIARIAAAYYSADGQSRVIDADIAKRCGQLLVEHANHSGEHVAFILISIKGYEQAYYLGGVEGGFRCRQQVSDRLIALFPKNTHVNALPFGFSIHAWGPQLEHRIANMVERISRQLRLPIAVEIEGDHAFLVSLEYQMGYLLYPDDCGQQTSFDNVTRFVAAATWAHSHAPNVVTRYDHSKLKALERRARIRERLTLALSKRQLDFAYQPQLDMVSRQIVGVEALLRWRDDVLGEVGPNEFVPVAEACELILPLTDLTIAEVSRFIAQHRHALPNGIRFSVNISKSVFNWSHFDLYECFKNTLKTSGWPSKSLAIEITESSYFDPWRSAQVVATLSRLKQLGIHTIIDDFGSGYGALSLISSGAVSCIKLDRELTAKLTSDSSETQFLEILCHAIRHTPLELIAEGVETEQQKAILLSKGVSTIQGYIFARPMPADALLGFIRQHSDNAQ